MIRVQTNSESRSEIMEIANIFRANIIDVSSDSLVLELTGGRIKIEAFQNMLRPFKILEVVRTGIAGLERGQK